MLRLNKSSGDCCVRYDNDPNVIPHHLIQSPSPSMRSDVNEERSPLAYSRISTESATSWIMGSRGSRALVAPIATKRM